MDHVVTKYFINLRLNFALLEVWVAVRADGDGGGVGKEVDIVGDAASRRELCKGEEEGAVIGENGLDFWNGVSESGLAGRIGWRVR